MQNLIPISAVIEVESEPRVRDVDLAKWLGFLKPLNIRELIARNRDELEAFGNFPCRAENLTGRGRPGKAYYLNEGQALVLCSLSRTAKAIEVRKQLIELFLTYRTKGDVVYAHGYKPTPQLLPATAVVDVGGVPRIRAADLAQWLEADHGDIRRLVSRNYDELDAFGNIPCRAENYIGRGKYGNDYFLNEAQTLALCDRSGAAKAETVRKQLVELFAACRNQKVVHVQEHRRYLPQPRNAIAAEPVEHWLDRDSLLDIMDSILARLDKIEART